MKKPGLFSRPPLLSRFVLLLGAILLAGVLFRSFFLENLIEPVALAAWWLARAFLNIDQQYYWGGLLLAAVAFAIRLLMEAEPAETAGGPADAAGGHDGLADRNVTLENLKAWRAAIHLSELGGQEILRRKLAELLVAAYRSQQPDATSLEVDRALRGGDLPLPHTVSALLFPPEREQGETPFVRRLKSILGTVRKWLHRWMGQERAACLRAADETLAWIETTLENPHEPEWKH